MKQREEKLKKLSTMCLMRLVKECHTRKEGASHKRATRQFRSPTNSQITINVWDNMIDSAVESFYLAHTNNPSRRHFRGIVAFLGPTCIPTESSPYDDSRNLTLRSCKSQAQAERLFQRQATRPGPPNDASNQASKRWIVGQDSDCIFMLSSLLKASQRTNLHSGK